ncbi:hypothetical protein BCR44DRAFT_57262 [Catenaria anguillulae PL171]|uniref:Uncharacterized protein n=1 Tax=Catenaria anguillulae PL171 TaxID=765915 RepID=A0A1Y2HKB2_9FUNG|nr:hypothetical protein BCR44DRAFT_57262 [Catenaria anguillulae PL171]
MRSIFILALIVLLSSSPAALAAPKNQINGPIPQTGELRVIVTPSSGSPVTVTIPAVAGLKGIDRCKEKEGFDPSSTKPHEVFCRTLRAELAKMPSTEPLSKAGQINVLLATGDVNQQPISGTPTFIEGQAITVAVTPPAGGAPVVLTLPAVPGLKRIPSCRRNDGMNPNDNSPDALYCRNLRQQAAEKVPGMSNIGQGGDINAQLATSSSMRQASAFGVVEMICSLVAVAIATIA